MNLQSLTVDQGGAIIVVGVLLALIILLGTTGKQSSEKWKFTKRDKHILVFLGIFAIVLAFIPQSILRNLEVPLLLFVIIPLAIYFASDPEKANS